MLQNITRSHFIGGFIFVVVLKTKGVCFHPKSLGYLVSGYYLAKRVSSPGVGVNPNQTLVD